MAVEVADFFVFGEQIEVYERDGKVAGGRVKVLPC